MSRRAVRVATSRVFLCLIRASAALVVVAVTAARPQPAHAFVFADLLFHCGGFGQRACCFFEAPAGHECDTGASQIPVTSPQQCTIPDTVISFPANYCGNAHSDVVEFCGGDGQRACCYGESPVPCDEGNRLLIDRPGGVCGEMAVFGPAQVGTCWKPTSCGGHGERACVESLDQREGCNDGVMSMFGCPDLDSCGPAIHWCYEPTSCGGEGQRRCCGGIDIGGTVEACAPDLISVPGVAGDATCGVPQPIGLPSNSSDTCVDPAHLIKTMDGGLPEPHADVVRLEPDLCGARGYADLHAHLFANLAYGGGVVAGEPYSVDGIGAALRQDYSADLDLVLPDGSPAPTDSRCRDSASLLGGEEVLKDLGCSDLFSRFHADHSLGADPLGVGLHEGPQDCTGNDCGTESNFGAPYFNGWPTWRSTTHQQMYWKWLERAWRGGLRLMVQYAVTNEAWCELHPALAGTDCSDDRASIDAQIDAAWQLQNVIDDMAGGPGMGWFRIVTSPDEAREVIRDGNLAVVLGIEGDFLGCRSVAMDDIDWFALSEEDADAAIHDLIRRSCLGEGEPELPPEGQHEPPPGGEPDLPASYIDDTIQEYYDRGVRVVSPVRDFETGVGAPAVWQDAAYLGDRLIRGTPWAVEDCSVASVPDPKPPKEGEPPAPSGPRYGGYAFALGSVPPYLQFLFQDFDFTKLSPYPYPHPTCHQKGLSALGKYFVRALMNAGMIVDVDHVSNYAFDDTMHIAERLGRPTIASHVQPFEAYVPSIRHERMRFGGQLAWIRDRGGMVGLMLNDEHQNVAQGQKLHLTYGPLAQTDPTFDDCRRSSKSWAQRYKYAADFMAGPVAMGSDFGGFASHIGPRFGHDACGRHYLERGRQELEGRLQYPFELPGFGRFERQQTGTRTYDFNVDGLAHVGLLPDFVADLGRIGLSDQDLDPLFRSAAGFVDVWDRAEGGTPSGIEFEQLQCEDQVVEADASCRAAEVSVAGADNDPGLTLVQTPAGQYALGANTVTLSTQQESECGVVPHSCTATVTVVDRTVPTISCPAPQMHECATVVPDPVLVDGTTVNPPPGTPVTLGTPVAGTDNCDASPRLLGCDAGSGLFSLGETTVTCQATDDAVPQANIGECQFNVTVVDTTPPLVTCPPNQRAECTRNGIAVVDPGDASGSDTCELLSVTEHEPDPYPLGKTTLNWAAIDTSGQRATCTTEIVVEDTTAPTIQCPADVVAECTGDGSASVDAGVAEASDICGDVSVSSSAGKRFPLGETTVTYLATDDVDLTATCTNKVTVRDTTPPPIASAAASPDKLWPPDKKIRVVSLAVSSTDRCDSAAAVCEITGVRSNEPIVAWTPALKSKDTWDWKKTGPLALELRSWRTSKVAPRVYTIDLSCKDRAGNASTSTATVTVPLAL